MLVWAVTITIAVIVAFRLIRASSLQISIFVDSASCQMSDPSKP